MKPRCGPDPSPLHLQPLLLAAILLVFALPRPGLAQPAALLDSCAWVRAENDGAGTGFVLDTGKRLVLTCRHVVADRTKVDLVFPWRREGVLVTDRAEYLRNRLVLREAGLLVSGKVLKTSDELDLALVEAESLPRDARAVRLSPAVPNCGDPNCGDQLTVIGNRLDLETLWNVTTGPLRASGRLADGYFWRGKKLAANARVLIGQLPTEEGDSGGPVFDEQGRLVGMASALRRQCPGAAIAISSAEVLDFTGRTPDRSDEKPARPGAVSEALVRSTVWIRPGATDIHLAGVLIDPHLVLTVGKGLAAGNKVGIAFPIRQGDHWVGERSAYRDPIGLARSGRWRSGVVLARDPDRDLALIRLDSPVADMTPVRLATISPEPGERVQAISHPSGLEFAWAHAGGIVRQRGKLSLGTGEHARRIEVLLCQLPAQAGSPGGPVLNDRGELVGILAARESTQQVGYAVAGGEIAAFLDEARTDRPAEGLFALLGRIEAYPKCVAAGLGRALAGRAEEHRLAGRLEAAHRDCSEALSLDAGCSAAYLCLARLAAGHGMEWLDAAIEKGPYDRGILLLRAELAGQARDFRKARGDLERVLDVDPLDAAARQLLVGVLLELNEDARACSAVGDTLRADPGLWPAMARDLLAQADTLGKKFPDAPSIAAGWLVQSLRAAARVLEPAKRKPLEELLELAGRTRDDGERLKLLRAGMAKWAEK
jgi:S1-C subfamily serine protease